jgi:long-chain fatty acid transport protein
MRFIPRAAGALLAGALLLTAGPLYAAGFALFEQGARGMGFAGAYTAQSSDPSAIFHNAAGIAFLKGKQLYVGGNLVHPSTEFTGDAPFPGGGVTETADVGYVPVPAVYYTQALGPRLSAGIGVNAPFGLKMTWQSPFSGRFISQDAKLTGVAVNPTVAYKLADRLAVGAGLDVRFSKLSLERTVPFVNPFTQHVIDAATVNLESDTATGFGFNVGALARPSEALSVGLSYRHKVTIDYEGTATFTPLATGNGGLDAAIAASLPSAPALTSTIVFPSIFSGGVAYHWNDWTAEGDVDWYQWSTFDQLPITFAAEPELSSVITEDYANTWQFRVGLERELTPTWAVRGGYFHDQSPAPAASVSPLLPDATRNGFALGGSWRSGQLRVDGALWYLTSPDRSTEGVSRDGYNGVYKSHALTMGLSLGYAF